MYIYLQIYVCIVLVQIRDNFARWGFVKWQGYIKKYIYVYMYAYTHTHVV